MADTRGTTSPPLHPGDRARAGRLWFRPAREWPTIGLCLMGGVLLVVSAVIHLHLWSTGYRNIPTIGPLFLLQGIAGIVLGVLVVALRSPVTSVAGAGFAGGTVVGLLLSVEVGLFGFQDSFSAPYATLSLVVEALATVVLLAAAAVGARGVLAGRPASGG